MDKNFMIAESNFLNPDSGTHSISDSLALLRYRQYKRAKGAKNEESQHQNAERQTDKRDEG